MPKRQSPPAARARDAKSPKPHDTGETEPRKPGRKPGKHSSPDYTQTSIYLPIELRNRVRAKLYEQRMEMSGLIEDMLRDWLERQR